jgi:hypothetical protein
LEAGSVRDSGRLVSDAQTDFQAPSGVALPPVNAGFDFQLGGAYPPPASVKIVTRDRKDKPASGLYNICYLNGFQTQTLEKNFWLSNYPDLVLRDSGGSPVIDEEWDEMILDVTTASKRARLAELMGGFIADCDAAGFDAVEIDNLDSYSRSGGLIKPDDSVAYIKLLSTKAHALGLAISQKNSAEFVPRRAEMGTDFAVAESCNRYRECDLYRKGYGDHILIIEYRRSDFDAGCAAYPGLSIILRDVELVAAGKAGYVFDSC